MGITKDQLLDLFAEFVSESGQFNTFLELAETKGYNQEEIDNILDNLIL